MRRLIVATATVAYFLVVWWVTSNAFGTVTDVTWPIDTQYATRPTSWTTPDIAIGLSYATWSLVVPAVIGFAVLAYRRYLPHTR